MSTDIIMSAKDFGRTGGLCGYFDNNWQNDYLLSNGNTTQNHELFAETWRYSKIFPGHVNFLMRKSQCYDRFSLPKGVLISRCILKNNASDVLFRNIQQKKRMILKYRSTAVVVCSIACDVSVKKYLKLKLMVCFICFSYLQNIHTWWDA